MDIDTYIAKIVQKVIETEEEFIFQTISPFCEEMTEKKISKKELINALVYYRELEEENQRLRSKLYNLETSLLCRGILNEIDE
jgi:cell shape-determining protein MreC